METDMMVALAARTDSDDPLAALGAAAQLRTEVERREAVLVRRAHNQGATWAEIAAVLGVSKQAVNKKHGGRRFTGRDR